MAKIHTRQKRLLGLSTSVKHRYFFQAANENHRARTFRTEDQAKAYAGDKGIKNYTIVPAKKTRFKIQLQ